MKLNPIKPNMTEVTINEDLTVLFSYKTPVACPITGEGYFKTEKKWSKTTSRHINQWVKGAALTKPQDYFDTLTEERHTS